MTGRLTVCATPIGNLRDAPPRLGELLASVDVVFAEDTRRTRILLDALGIRADVESYFAGNEAQRCEELRGRLGRGQHVALVSDAGVPAVSDPGTRAVHTAHEVGAAVSVVPGPSAVTAAVAVAGFGGDRFVFEGFLPKKGKDRRRRLESIAREERPVVLFAAPTRVLVDLEDLAGACGGQRAVAVARELTKVHEEVWRGTLEAAVAKWSEEAPRGEFTIVLDGAAEIAVSLADAVADVQTRLGQGEAMSGAVRAVAELTGVGRRALYEAVLRKER